MGEEKIFDRDGLRERTMGEVELMEQLIVLFKTDSAEQLANLQQLAQEGQQLELSRAAHQLKGSALNVGADALAAAAARLEQAAEENAGEAQELVQEVTTRHAELMAALDEEG